MPKYAAQFVFIEIEAENSDDALEKLKLELNNHFRNPYFLQEPSAYIGVREIKNKD